MLQIIYIRQNIDLVKERLGVRNFVDSSLVDAIVQLDEQVRIVKVESESLQAQLNAASKEIGMLMGKGEREAAEQKKTEVAESKKQVQHLNEKLELYIRLYETPRNYVEYPV